MNSPATAWTNRNYRIFWVGQSSFPIGFQVTQFVLPLMLLHLGAGGAVVGFLRTANLLPHLLLSVPAGILADGAHSRRIMVGSDIVRLLTMLTVMTFASLHVLDLWMLFIAVFVLGSATVFYEISFHPVLLGLISREQIASGNLGVEVSRAFATLAGPALAGLVIGFAPIWTALAIDAVVAVVSLATLLLLRAPTLERPVEPRGESPSLRMALDGFRQVSSSPLLRSSVYFVASRNLFAGMFTSYVLVFKVQNLGLSVSVAATADVIGNVGFLAGALGAGWVGRKIGLGPLLLIGASVNAVGILLVVNAPASHTLVFVIGGLFVYSLGVAVINLQNQILRHSITPYEMQGRVNSFLRLANLGVLSLGAALGGALVGLLDLQTMLFISAFGATATTMIIVVTPLRSVRELPSPEPVWARQ
ncbi:MFS transporter [Streptomonospora algeriensis]|uniref:MFS transporter n=1 Tax=Streptomonospora algeriensis TaxID=995084 RepID=A0ABW3BAH3_9ACTN